MVQVSAELVQKTLHNQFSIETHKKVFINYLEVIVDMYGTVHYAIPSHQDWLIAYAMRKLKITKERLSEMLPYAGVIEELCKKMQCVSVWNDYFIGCPNKAQRKTMTELTKAGLYADTLKNFQKD